MLAYIKLHKHNGKEIEQLVTASYVEDSDAGETEFIHVHGLHTCNFI